MGHLLPTNCYSKNQVTIVLLPKQLMSVEACLGLQKLVGDSGIPRKPAFTPIAVAGL